jgi:glycosyltransferase involved in cell wall biosynthesis
VQLIDFKYQWEVKVSKINGTNPENIKEAVLRVMNLPVEDKRALLARAKAMVIERYNWKLISAEMETMFKTLTP